MLELAEGETLADRIARGPVPVSEAVPIARQIVDALEPSMPPSPPNEPITVIFNWTEMLRSGDHR